MLLLTGFNSLSNYTKSINIYRINNNIKKLQIKQVYAKKFDNYTYAFTKANFVLNNIVIE